MSVANRTLAAGGGTGFGTPTSFTCWRLPALSALGVPVQGGMSTLNPSSGNGTFGPSWRMVVELGPEVRGWGIYPGGQSGNPASSRYLDRLAAWSDGRLDTLFVPRTAEEVGPRLLSDLRLEPGR